MKKEKNVGPQEMPSNKPVSRFVPVARLNKRKRSMDPRFDSTAQGDMQHAEVETYRKRYGFLDEVRTDELTTLNKQLKKLPRYDHMKREMVKAQINAVKQDIADQKRKDSERNAITAWKKEENAARKQGKAVFHLKDSERKKLILTEHYKQLKTDGKLEKYMTKRRKKNAQKDRRWID
jgi:ribosomal RNA-processing protein 36